jgi:hypothetical protein
MKHTVWIFAVVRVKIPDVEAENHEDAMKKAEENTDLHAVLDRDGIQFADEIDCFHVDEENDLEYEHSCWYDSDYSPL